LLRGGDVVELNSDLGGGKTTLMKGIAKGLGYEGEVTSPTFTISRVYQLPNDLELHHFDFYRLNSADIVNQELAEVVGQPDVIVAIEWAQNAAKVLPRERLKVQLDWLDQNKRSITIAALGERYKEIIRGLSS
jgi:tRNA threonylcarbamoyladenosine biosynthesis protein TsaE